MGHGYRTGQSDDRHVVLSPASRPAEYVTHESVQEPSRIPVVAGIKVPTRVVERSCTLARLGYSVSDQQERVSEVQREHVRSCPAARIASREAQTERQSVFGEQPGIPWGRR